MFQTLYWVLGIKAQKCESSIFLANFTVMLTYIHDRISVSCSLFYTSDTILSIAHLNYMKQNNFCILLALHGLFF